MIRHLAVLQSVLTMQISAMAGYGKIEKGSLCLRLHIVLFNTYSICAYACVYRETHKGLDSFISHL